MILSVDGASTSEWEAKAGIEGIFRLLGSPHHRALISPVDSPYSHRSNWECGCTLDYFVDDSGGAFRWHGCIAHSERAVASFIARATL
jgi:hypothetical protein